MKVSKLTVFTFLGVCSTACVTVNEDKGDNSSSNGDDATAGANTAGVGGHSGGGGTTQSSGGSTTQSSGGGGSGGGGSDGGGSDGGASGGIGGMGGASESTAGCKTFVSIFCDKAFACFAAEQLDPNVVGNNKADCETKLGGTDCTDQKTKCDSGKEYQPSVAQECLDQFEALSCAQFTSYAGGETELPAACDQLCQ